LAPPHTIKSQHSAGSVSSETVQNFPASALENVLERLVGEIQDEFDIEQPELSRINENEFFVPGSYGLHDIRALTDLDLQNADVSTVAGYFLAMLGRMPRKGDQVRIGNYTVTVAEAKDRRIERLHFARIPRDANALPRARFP
jgi:CBS domain containing-hemolysin-like protein